ncbi:hypothetical protein HELRODRAFT_177855 [Helobdella robusta]|uniref:Leucine-rich repeat-containing protein 51 n=1 Tax=Helobdella robusta TaxID=6412 RepID=T1FCD5_HELRO|nr:hypothetical protein HELRODRAFT_177855 [Helobdella robusta]ESN97792.1 hypothetical protein HELRODRAFT_177855 [Helobdella robusta]
MLKKSRKESVKKPVVNVIEEKKILDYSFLKLTSLTELPYEIPRNVKSSAFQVKHSATILKLNNNLLEGVLSFMEHLNAVIVKPELLVWIDLSCNSIPKIEDAFENFTELQILLLHGNKIEDRQDVLNLLKCKKLIKLTLHGNPIESSKNYKYFVIANVPQLKSFDMSTISRLDLISADAIFPNDRLKKIINQRFFPCSQK